MDEMQTRYRWPRYRSPQPASHAATGRQGGAQWTVRNGGCPSLWDQHQNLVSVAGGLRQRWPECAVGQAHSRETAQAWTGSNALAREGGARQHAHAVQIRIRLVDALAAGRIDPPRIRTETGAGLGQPHHAFVGLHGAKAAVPGLAARPCDGAPVGERNLSRHTSAGAGHWGHDLLCRRVGHSLGLSHRNNLGAARPNAGGGSDRQALFAEHDFGSRAARRVPFHAARGQRHRPSLSRIPQALDDRPEGARVCDRGRTPDSQSQTRARLCTKPRRSVAVVLLATVLAADQSRRAGMGARQASGFQAPRAKPRGNEAIGPWRAQAHSATAPTGPVVLSTARMPIRRYVTLLSKTLVTVWCYEKINKPGNEKLQQMHERTLA